ncbi:UNVERIFIED_CONTAM: UDP-N-acetylglucosamine diphosphorylase 1 [Sesamum radiatum]|uniref:UDP-N-acetylglucosamine diphosphorylase 1 n=1 Tax=Sesamum radiatum TaxID=300843 RepID=A0AAW2T3B2_SESRA
MREPVSDLNETSHPPQSLLERLKDYGQEDAFALWDELSSQERHHLVNDIQTLDLPRIDRIIRCSFRSQGLPAAAIEPVPETNVSTVEKRTMEERERWWKMGLKAISDGKLGVLLLSGGQGTRLGSSDPKGCFNIGLPSGKSLFQLQAERILCIQRLAAQSVNEGSASVTPIHWYIMTSPFTDEPTRKFFESHKYFGLEAEQVTFFQQGTIPCVSRDGRFIMETPYRPSPSSEICVIQLGRWSCCSFEIFKVIGRYGYESIKYLDCYGVDNALVRVADPTFLGYFMETGVAAAAKVVRKAYPQEKVGVFVRRGKGGPVSVVEYSELDQSLASAINQETGRLRFCWSNVCLHMFTLEFLNQVANGLEKDSMSVLREEEFAPVKNANGSNFDTPDSARLLVLRLHTRWVVAAGGFLTHSVWKSHPFAHMLEKTLRPSAVGEHFTLPLQTFTRHSETAIRVLSALPLSSPPRHFAQPARMEDEEKEEVEIDQRRLPADYDPANFDPTEHRSPPTAELSSIMMRKLGMKEKPGTAGVAGAAMKTAAAAKEEKKPEKTAFELKMESFDAASKLKILEEIMRSIQCWTNRRTREVRDGFGGDL